MTGTIPLCLYNDKVIYSVETQHKLIIKIKNLATCFGSFNYLQAILKRK
jgi:hypothetical protein